MTEYSRHQIDPKFWQDRAEEVRTLADGTSNGIAKETLLDIAAKYDVLAKLAAQRAARVRKRN